jgi:putative AlgH/UPF0301 family transcriptional regulator
MNKPKLEGNRILLKSLYAALMRLAWSFDRKRPAKALIYRESSSYNAKSGPTAYYASVLDKILGSSLFFHPSKVDLSFKAIVRDEFRSNRPIGENDRITAGFAFLRKFSAVWAQYEAIPSNRPRKKIPKDDKFQVSFSQELSVGSMLCAHPLIHGHQQRSIVLILEHSDKLGSYGVILNKKTDHTVKSGIINLPLDFTRSFGKNPLNFGGMVHRVQVIHPYKECGGKTIPNCSVPFYQFSQSNLPIAVELVKKTPSTLKNFHFIVGCCLWAPRALQNEVDDGTWILIKGEADRIIEHSKSEVSPPSSESSSKKAVLSDPLIPTPVSANHNHLPRSLFGGVKETRGRDLDTYEGQNETWCKVMTSLGRNTNHFASLSPSLDAALVDSVSWEDPKEPQSESEDEDDV